MCANEWDVFHHMQSRGGRGRRAALAFVVCFWWGGYFMIILFFLLFSSNAHGLIASMRPRYLIYLPTSNGPCERVVPFLISLQIRICMCDSTS